MSWCHRAIGILCVPRVKKINATEATPKTTETGACSRAHPAGVMGSSRVR